MTEFDITSLTTGASTSTHYELTGLHDLEACLDDLTERLNTTPIP